MAQRYARARQLRRLDPIADRVEIGKTLTDYEFPWEFLRSLELALFRTYAVPSIGGLLDRTGEFTADTQRRYDDTALLLYSMWRREAPGAETAGPPDADPGDQLNFIHGHYRISNDDFRYTLATFVVMPVRWIRAWGWRRLSVAEVQAWTNLMRDMGETMHIADIPDTYDEFSELLDAYEAEHFAYDPANERVATATIDLFASWYPKPTRRLVRWGLRQVVDESVARAVGLPPASPTGRRVVSAALRGRARVLRLLPPRTDERPFVFQARSHPDGYRVDELGPPRLVRRSGASEQTLPVGAPIASPTRR